MERRIWRDGNYFLLLCVLILLGFGVLSVYSATLNAVSYGQPMNILFPRHLKNIVIGLVAMGGMMLVDYRAFRALALPFYLVVVAILTVVLVIGEVTSGAQSWLSVGTRTIQPSEFCKLLIILVLASYWAHFEEHRDHWLVHVGSLLVLSVPLFLVFIQPDLGTAMIFGAIWFVMAWTAGIRWQQLVTLLLVGFPLVLVGWEYLLNPVQKTRLLTFYWLLTEPTKVDLQREGYNIVQALNAISSGGLVGTGLTRGLLSQGNYVPVQYSDFIFAVIGEELGFIGGTIVLIFQGLLLLMTLSIASRARDRYGQLIATGIFGLFLSHILINVGVTMSIMPVTGLPLPFISYGGSFTITTLAAVGLLESIAMRRRKIIF